MRDQKELLALINECEGNINKMKADLDGYYDALEPKVDPLMKASEEKENEKKSIKKQSAPAILWVIFGALVVGAIVCNSINIMPLAGGLFTVAVVVLVLTLVKNSKYNKAYQAQVSKIDEELDRLQDQIDKIYDSDSRIAKTEEKIKTAEKELKKLNAEYEDIKVVESIGQNNLFLYCSFAAISTNKCFPIFDGHEYGIMPKSFAAFKLEPGDHTFFMNVLRPETIIDMDDIDFSVNDTNKYIYINHDMRTYEYETKVCDSFEDFASNLKDKKWVKEELVKATQNRMQMTPDYEVNL